MNIIETERLTLRQISGDDFINLSKVLSDPLVMKYSTVGIHTEQQIDDYITNCITQYKVNGFGPWAICNTKTGGFIGVCGLNKHNVEGGDIVHINYRLMTIHQGNGYAVESVLGVLDFAKKTLKLKVLHALIESANTRSVNVVHKTGFQFQKSSVFRGVKVDIYQIDL